MSAADAHQRSPAGAHASRVSLLQAIARKTGEASFFYADPHFQCDAVKVLPGEYFVSNEEIMVMTVLGSCIAACLWDSQARVGGMNHFMLPDAQGGNGSDDGEAPGRYGAYAMELLINEMLKLGAKRETMQAKIFGGGAVMAGFMTLNVGQRNTQFVRAYLAAERIPVMSADVRDIHPRKVCFFPKSGKAMVKRLAHVHPQTLAVEARRGDAALVARATAGGSVDLF